MNRPYVLTASPKICDLLLEIANGYAKKLRDAVPLAGSVLCLITM